MAVNSILNTAEERIGELEDRSIEMSQNTAQRNNIQNMKEM